MGEVRQRTELRPGSYPFSGFGNGSEKTEKERKIEPKRILQKIAREKNAFSSFSFALCLCVSLPLKPIYILTELALFATFSPQF